ncbi:hypothetical protein XENORESO_006989 [Xenotaenia resolanae]|uniref:Uncharacterized protein n=1 Tax=Xenotaenia resolanae TaxID=208358 RepID=A0ABV0VV98_9TELE
MTRHLLSKTLSANEGAAPPLPPAAHQQVMGSKQNSILTEITRKIKGKQVSFPKYTTVQHFFKYKKKGKKIHTVSVKIINKDKVLCIPSQPAIVLEKTTKKLSSRKQNNGSYSSDENKQLIYFTALM